jgi:hypothetical protein
MATIIPKFTLTSTTALTQDLTISKSDSLTVNGDVEFKRITLSTTAKLILDASELNASYVWLYNTDGSIAISIVESEGGEAHIVLAAGEFAWFPWSSTVDLLADAASGTPVLEIGIFEQS